jgi:hypothetical protein
LNKTWLSAQACCWLPVFTKDSSKTIMLIIAHPVIQRPIAITRKSKKAGTHPKIRKPRADKTKVLSVILKFFDRFNPALMALHQFF